MLFSLSFTTIVFFLKLTFALFMVCLLHFYVFIPDVAQTLRQLSQLFSNYSGASYFLQFHPPTEALPEPLACSLPAMQLSSWGLPSAASSVFSIASPVSRHL